MDNYELTYLRNINDIKDDFINQKISKKEYEEKLEIEKQKYIEFLQNNNRLLMEDMQRKYDFDQFIKILNGEEMGNDRFVDKKSR